MIDVVFSPDLLRLLTLPAFGWAAWRDRRTRRVPGWLWPPLWLLGLGLLAWELLDPSSELALRHVVFSVGALVPLALVCYRQQLLGGADAKALIALAVLFPTYPALELAGARLPLVEQPLGVFSLTVVLNGALVSLLYPVGLAARNVVDGRPASGTSRAVPWTSVPSAHGWLVDDGLRLDLDALRMYLRWRRVSLVDVRVRPGELRDPATVPDEPGEPGDGRVDPDEQLEPAGPEDVAAPAPDGGSFGDPWGAESFLEDVDGAYGTTAEQLRAGLALLAQADRVTVSPGMPYLVPLVAGLLLGVVYGDAVYGLVGPFPFT